MRRFKRGQRLLLVGSVLAGALFGDGLLTFAQQKAEPELMWEMRFEQGKPQVVRNEVARLKREGKAEKFPLRMVVNQKDHRIRFFDEDGNLESGDQTWITVTALPHAPTRSVHSKTPDILYKETDHVRR